MNSSIKIHEDLPKDPMEFALQIVGWASTIMQPVMDEAEGQRIADVIVARLADTKTVMDTLSKKLKEDKEYAHAWHCNLAMSFSDAIPEDFKITNESLYEIRNEGARKFMKLCFDVDTSNEMLG